MIAPYAYAATPMALQLVAAMGAKDLVILHLPDRQQDDYRLWNAVDATVAQNDTVRIWIPQMQQSITI
jgi:ribonuclease BN (tRNA processing enzyme)